jgi:hypothetical protein
MSLIPGAHKKDYPFAEYTGYDKASEGKPHQFVQYEIPENFLSGVPYVCEAKLGDAVVFHRMMPHRSNPTRDGYGFALVARAWIPSDDLTLSGKMSATPYGGDIGRADLTVEP